MSIQNLPYSYPYLNQRKHFAMERGPRMLKDCLLEDSNSCSSNGFKSFPRRPLQPCPVTPQQESKANTVKKKKKKKAEASLRSRSRTLQVVINAVKSLQFSALKSAPSILPRSLSRRLSKKDENKHTQAEMTVRVKDIVRWRLSRDLNEDVTLPSDFEPSPPHHYTTTTTVTTTTGSTATASSTPCSSWCDSDFTSEFLPSCGGNSDEYGDKDMGQDTASRKNNLPSQCVGEEDSTEARAATVADTQVGPTEDLPCDGENDRSSPVSILDLQYEEDEDASDSSFSQILDNVERTKKKLMQKIKRFESLAKISPFNLDKWMLIEEDCCTEGGPEADVNDDDEDYDDGDGDIEEAAGEELDEFEDKAVELWNLVKEGCAIWIHEEHLVMDFFRDKLSRRLNSHHETYRDQEFENELVAQAKAWMRGEKVSDIEHGSVEQRRKACVRDMEREEGKGKRLEEEREEAGIEIEDGLFNLLVDEMLTDLYLC